MMNQLTCEMPILGYTFIIQINISHHTISWYYSMSRQEGFESKVLDIIINISISFLLCFHLLRSSTFSKINKQNLGEFCQWPQPGVPFAQTHRMIDFESCALITNGHKIFYVHHFRKLEKSRHVIPRVWYYLSTQLKSDTTRT